jgi:ankyrin repeat protein
LSIIFREFIQGKNDQSISDLQEFHDVLSRGADPDFCSEEDKNTPLMLAAALGKVFFLQTLLNIRPNLEARNADGETALGLAMKFGQVSD